jgi:hypothetical protein
MIQRDMSQADASVEVERLAQESVRLHNEYQASEIRLRDAKEHLSTLWKERARLDADKNQANHYAAGKCRADIGDWHIQRCPNRARPGSMFCGTHKNRTEPT